MQATAPGRGRDYNWLARERPFASFDKEAPAMTATAIVGPHKAIPVTTAREKFCAELFDVLWDRYRQRVSYVQTYEQVIRAAGATFVNDHIAFRTFATQQPLAGISSISRIF